MVVAEFILYRRNAVRCPKDNSAVRHFLEARDFSRVRLHNGIDDPLWDCYFCELQSDINAAEVEGMITTEQADYLRVTYLRLRNFK